MKRQLPSQTLEESLILSGATYLVFRMGYNRRALKARTGFACGLCVAAFFLLSPTGATLADPKRPRNVN